MSIQLPTDASLPVCSFVGNSDVYGLGIRVGIYLQWLASLLSKVFLGEEALRSVLNENAIFLLALFLATILLATDTITGVHSLDILIMLHIFFGGLFTIYDTKVEERIEYLSSLAGYFFKAGIVAGMAAVGVWFWFYNVQIPEDASCKSFAFLFGRVGLYSVHTITSFKAISVINLVFCLSALYGLLFYRIYVWIGWLKVVVRDQSNPLGGESPIAERRILAMLMRKTAMDKKKLLTDLWTVFLEAIVQSTVPAKRDYEKEFEKYYGRDLVGEDYDNDDFPHDWPELRVMLLKIEALNSSLFLKALVVLTEALDTFIGHHHLINGQNPALEVESPYNLAPMKRKLARALVILSNIRTLGTGRDILVSIAIMIYSIISIELLIRYNEITEVYTILSTGQIIPLVIGFAAVWRTSWEIIVMFIQKHRVLGVYFPTTSFSFVNY